ncbi:hypothetical protein [Paracoccus methylarcula]|uniref:Uncharacterized protein n=1 Tax=Paracoccus methylarcula TaxID=72022 RepID=A0A422QUQ5_9RHOB|nr:hypothetical protein [Paracoccus methylarcula]RNF33729.1 hypothetical protein A7A09_014685 [Paracoccus methylarcula]
MSFHNFRMLTTFVALFSVLPAHFLTAQPAEKALSNALSDCRQWAADIDGENLLPEPWKPILENFETQNRLDSFYLNSSYPLYIYTSFEETISETLPYANKICRIRSIDTSTGAFSWIGGEINVGNIWDDIRPLPDETIRQQLSELAYEFEHDPNIVPLLGTEDDDTRMLLECNRKSSISLLIPSPRLASADWSLEVHFMAGPPTDDSVTAEASNNCP